MNHRVNTKIISSAILVLYNASVTLQIQGSESWSTLNEVVPVHGISLKPYVHKQVIY